MSVDRLDERLDALREVRRLGEGTLPSSAAAELDGLLERADRRRALSADHTVVGLFGATGSGKSSLLNALVGEELARTHVRRPTTAEPLAVTWDATGAQPLLDWLGVRDRRSGTSALDARAQRVILLDLPDFDSVESTHRAVAERLAGQVDVLVWVVDPQKYADAVLHSDFVATHSRHAAVTLAVLNQVDLLLPRDVPRVIESLRGILAADGLGSVPVLPTSATTGEGVAQLRTAIGDVAARQVASTARLSADVANLAGGLPGAYPDGRAPVRSARGSRRLEEQLAVAAGADVVARAVAGSYRMRSGRATGWPVVSWLLRFRADPLRRLGLVRSRDQDPELHRSSLPPMNAGAQARVSLAVREFADEAASALTEPWRAEVRRAAGDALESLPPALDLAVSRARLPVAGSWWWAVFAVLQWVSLLAALAGVLWLLGLALLPTAGIVPPPAPVVEGWPVTTLLVLGGVLLGVVLGLAASGIGAAVAASRRRRARAAVAAEVARVCGELVVAPIAAELDRAARYSAALAVARGR